MNPAVYILAAIGAVSAALVGLGAWVAWSMTKGNE